MTDRFIEYLSENEERLNPEAPGERVWEQIRRRSVKRKGIVVSLSIKRMAAACMLLLAVTAIYVLTRDREDDSEKPNLVRSGTPAADTVQKFPLVIRKDQKKEWPASGGIKRPPATERTVAVSIPKTKYEKKKVPVAAPKNFVYISGEELALKYANNFTKLIENEKRTISTTPVYGVAPDYFEIFLKDYQLLEADEEKLKEKIKATGGSLDALDEMILHFQRRIDLLKRLRSEIERKNNLNADKKDLPVNYVRII